MTAQAHAPDPSVDMPPGGTVVPGPSAFAGGFPRFLALTRTLAIQDFKLKFFGSILGYLWQLMRPIMLFGVLYVVFSVIVRLGDVAPHYPVMLLFAIVLFTFFAEATSGAVTSVLDRENLVRKIHFPRMVIPMTVVATATLNLLLNLVVVGIFAAASGVEPRLTWLLLPPLIFVLGLYAAGLAALVSALYVRYRDMRPIWDVVLQLTFYASPVIYPIEYVLERFPKIAHVMMANPFAVIIQQGRHWLVDPSTPTAAEAIGGAPRLLIPLAIALAAVIGGIWIFNREAPRIAEEL